MQDSTYSEIKYPTINANQSYTPISLSNYSSLDRSYVKYDTIGKNNQLVLLKNRNGEKRELSSLNDKFAGYIERLKLLELQNKRLHGVKQLLLASIDTLKDKFLHFYKQEISSLNSSTSNVDRDIAVLNGDLPASQQKSENGLQKLKSMNLEYDDLQVKVKKINEELNARRNDIALFKRRMNDINEEMERSNLKKINIIQRLNSVQEQSQREKLKIKMAESDKISLQEEIALLRQTQQCEVEEFMQTLIDGWKNEKISNIGIDLTQAISSARKDFECQVDNTRFHLMRKYEQILNHTREKTNPLGQDQSLNQMIDRMKRARRNMLGEIDNCKATLSFLRLKENDLNKAISEERDEFDKAEEAHKNQLLQLEDHIQKMDGNIEEALKNEITIKNEISEYRALLEGNSDNQGGLRSVVESLARHDDFTVYEDTRTQPINKTSQKDYSASFSTMTKNRQNIKS